MYAASVGRKDKAPSTKHSRGEPSTRIGEAANAVKPPADTEHWGVADHEDEQELMMHNPNRMNERVPDANAIAQSEIRPTYAQLKPKGACWYCNQPLDNVRRFCGKTCADDYRTEEALTIQEGGARADSVDQAGSRTGT